ncbi:MAG: hypothetical protein GF353_27935 [Candidatus Lokiarchaeota archaeon]|nr:hypothetical protein [Candidatus Lokiarchaeota archaeon]
MGKLGKISRFFRLNRLLAWLCYFITIRPYPIKYLRSDGQFLYEELIILLNKKGIKVILGVTKLKKYIKKIKKWKVDIITSNHAESKRKILSEITSKF